MRWLTYRHDGVERVGILDAEDTVRGLTPGIAMLDLLRSPGGLSGGAAQAMTSPDHVAAAADVTLCAPLQPPSIRDCLGFLQHLRNCAAPAGLTIDRRYEQVPAFYFTNPAAVLGPANDVAVFPGSRQFDYELEVCAVIGKPGRDIPPRQGRRPTSPATPFSATGAHATCRSTSSPWEPGRRRAKTAPSPSARC